MKHQHTVTRESQQADTLYLCGYEDEYGFFCFVTPDGEGRFFYDTIAEAISQHGDLPMVRCEVAED